MNAAIQNNDGVKRRTSPRKKSLDDKKKKDVLSQISDGKPSVSENRLRNNRDKSIDIKGPTTRKRSGKVTKNNIPSAKKDMNKNKNNRKTQNSKKRSVGENMNSTGRTKNGRQKQNDTDVNITKDAGSVHSNGNDNNTYSKKILDTETMNKDGTHMDEEWNENKKQKASRDIESETEMNANKVTPYKRTRRRNKSTLSSTESTSDTEQKERCVETLQNQRNKVSRYKNISSKDNDSEDIDGNDSYESNSHDEDDSDYNNNYDEDSSSESMLSSSSDYGRVKTSDMTSTRNVLKNTSANSRSIVTYGDTFSTTNDKVNQLNFRKYEDSHEKQRRRTKQSKLNRTSKGFRRMTERKHIPSKISLIGVGRGSEHEEHDFDENEDMMEMDNELGQNITAADDRSTNCDRKRRREDRLTNCTSIVVRNAAKSPNETNRSLVLAGQRTKVTKNISSEYEVDCMVRKFCSLEDDDDIEPGDYRKYIRHVVNRKNSISEELRCCQINLRKVILGGQDEHVEEQRNRKRRKTEGNSDMYTMASDDFKVEPMSIVFDRMNKVVRDIVSSLISKSYPFFPTKHICRAEKNSFISSGVTHKCKWAQIIIGEFLKENWDNKDSWDVKLLWNGGLREFQLGLQSVRALKDGRNKLSKRIRCTVVPLENNGIRDSSKTKLSLLHELVTKSRQNMSRINWKKIEPLFASFCTKKEKQSLKLYRNASNLPTYVSEKNYAKLYEEVNGQTMVQCISSKMYAFIVTVIHNNIILSGRNKNALEWNSDGKEALRFTSPSARGGNGGWSQDGLNFWLETVNKEGMTRKFFNEKYKKMEERPDYFNSDVNGNKTSVVETEVEVEDDIDKYSLDMEIPSDID